MTSKITGIYKIENKINNKKYIGQSKNIHRRWKQHKHYLNKNQHENQYLQSAWNKYGENSFNFEIICKCNEVELNQWEEYYINKYDTFSDRNKGYNLQSGGDYKQLSNEVCKKISQKNSGKNHHGYGKLLTTTHQKKISGTTTTTGYFRVTKHKDKTCLKGFRYIYRYYQNGKRKEISSVNITKLERNVIKQGLDWFIVDEKKAEVTLNESNIVCDKKFEHHTLNSRKQISKTKNTSGYYGVTKTNTKAYRQGFCYMYQYYDDNGKRKKISAKTIEDLKRKVISKSLLWEKF